MLPISICIIAKNEERTLDKCLSSLTPLNTEIIFVDTGSLDRTKEIATGYTDKIYDFNWIDDFSAARNFSISKAINDWILVIDCDEYLEEFDEKQILDFMECHPDALGEITRRDLYGDLSSQSVYISRIQRFFNKKYFRYDSPIHENLIPIQQKDFEEYPVELQILHDGYFNNLQNLQNKNERNIRILKKALKTKPNDAYYMYQLGQSYYALKNYETALSWYQESMKQKLNFTSVAGRSLVNSWINCLNELHRSEEALQILPHYDELSDTADFLYYMGNVYTNLGRYVDAVREYLKAAQTPKFNKEGTNSFLPYYRIGILYEALGDIKTAVAMYQKCGNYDPAIKKIKQLT